MLWRLRVKRFHKTLPTASEKRVNASYPYSNPGKAHIAPLARWAHGTESGIETQIAQGKGARMAE